MNSKYNKILIALAIGAVALKLVSCTAIPKGAKAVKPFKKDRYLGKWYEIARMDFKFEKNLNNVTANYSLNEDGSIKVDNRGYNYIKKEWKESIGKAKFVKGEDEARLKVSFFGPFYAGYNVIQIDPDYKYALVAGNNLKYLWILSRTKDIPDTIKSVYLDTARKLGYETGNLVWTAHN
ncbi:lipocalin family protein [Pedobacter paludis]|uniref:Outer membrane lipoprotein Blc n=1 Tax=Pedobacter paludis TaxID=2203212 RepID=A0A317EXZ3_9SPHI|nr:lipocalin family protein [Pedobacter paludis]PWS31711.1 lipocalin [Pedobacter paludis]